MAGRPMNPVSKDLPPEIQAWLRTWRAVVLDPLRTLRWSPWPIQRMADELALRVEGREGTGGDGRLRDASGVSKTTLQKEMAGERMPTRDVVQHLLDIAAESLPDPPGPERRQALWDSYYPALELKVPLLASLYRAVDARDEAVRALAAAEERERRLLAELSRQVQEQVTTRESALVRDDVEPAEFIARERGILIPPSWPDAFRERLQSLSFAGRALSQQLDALSSELDELRARRAAWRALRVIRRAQRRREQELAAEVTALRAARDELLDRLYRAQSEAEDTRRWAQAQADAQLAHLREDLEAAQAEAIRRDADLSRLVEKQRTRLAGLRERSVLSAADDVLTAALDRLSRRPNV
ncbi:hypothetical protein AB0M39_08210 [Streptomyces sp. NPDC051907]|uniref:hypothetical protein n=1 Tax=Streptomyces sp. NPDC051907 TaxID=3155284 RepID=UPI0034435594